MGELRDWNLLKSFLAVARSGKLTVGARTLCVDHTTLSRRIVALEKSLGVRLFERHVSGYSLTPDGERLVKRAEDMEGSVLDVERQFSRSNSRVTGTVRIGAPDGFGATILAPAIGKLAAEHPDLVIDLVATPRIFSLSKREADIAFVLACPPRGRIHGRKLTDYELGVYAAKAKPELWKRVATRSDLASCPFVSYIDDLIFTPELDYLPEISPSVAPRIRSSNLIVQWQATVAGAGLCVLPCFFADADHRLIRVLSEDVWLRRTFWMIVHSDMRNIARIRVTCDFVVEEVRRLRGRFLPTRGESRSPG